MVDFRAEMFATLGEEVVLSEGIAMMMAIEDLVNEAGMREEDALSKLVLHQADAAAQTADKIGVELSEDGYDSILESSFVFVAGCIEYAAEQIEEHGAEAVIDRMNRYSGCGDCANCRRSNEGYQGGMYL